jgi:ABC-2 type transport system ATP-binding protein
MHVLEIRRLTKKFGDVHAVDGLSLSVREGEIFGLLGPNGAGKSTTILMIASLLSSTEGEIRVFGRNIAEHPKFARQQIGLVPQDLAIYEEMTAYENVAFFAGLYGLRGRELRSRAEEALAFVGLEDKRNRYAKTFSGGMKRRLNIACAIAHRPKLIILDEPTVGIDPHSRQSILSAVRRLNEAGSTVLYTSHYMEEAESLCTRIAVMDHGKVIAEGTLPQLTSVVTDRREIAVTLRGTYRVEEGALDGIPGVRSVASDDNRLLIEADAEVNNLNAIIRAVTASGAEIADIETRSPNLETVFLALTGRSLRDD